MIYAPIWKDTYYYLTDSTQTGLDPLDYSITLTTNGVENEIFRGRAYQRPTDTFIRLNINKICQNYLSNDIQSLLESGAQSAVTNEAYGLFKLYDDNTDTLLETYGFLYDWSYDAKDFGSDILMSNPVNGHYDARMKTLMTYWEYNDKTVRNYCRRGLEFDEPLYPTLSCGDYALYYQNVNGGWDSFLIEGKGKKKDSIKRNSISTVFNNQTLDFEKRNYNNQITSTYELHTGMLTEEEAANIAKNLIPSTRIYIHDLNENKILPVTVTDSNAEYKRHSTGKVITYTINVEESRTKINI